MAGFTTSFEASGEDIYVVKTDLDGELIWEKTFGGEGDDNAWSIETTTGGNYIIAGFSNSFSSGDWDIYVLSIDGEGNELWSKHYPMAQDQFAWDILPDRNGGILIAGQTNATESERETALCLKIDENGDIVWRYQSEETDANRAFGVIQTDDAYFLSGMTSTDITGVDGFITRLATDGTEVWRTSYGGPKDDILHAINRSPDGNIIVSGYSKSYSAGHNSPWVLKVGAAGDEIWSNSFGSQLEERIVSAHVSESGETTLLGYVFKASGVDLLLVQTDPNGQLNWMTTFGSDKNEEAGQTLIKNDKNQFVYTGRTFKNDQRRGDLFLMVHKVGLD